MTNKESTIFVGWNTSSIGKSGFSFLVALKGIVKKLLIDSTKMYKQEKTRGTKRRGLLKIIWDRGLARRSITNIKKITKNNFIFNRYLKKDLVCFLLFDIRALDIYLIPVKFIPTSVRVTVINTIERAREYKPNNSGRSNYSCRLYWNCKRSGWNRWITWGGFCRDKTDFRTGILEQKTERFFGNCCSSYAWNCKNWCSGCWKNA